MYISSLRNLMGPGVEMQMIRWLNTHFRTYDSGWLVEPIRWGHEERRKCRRFLCSSRVRVTIYVLVVG